MKNPLKEVITKNIAKDFENIIEKQTQHIQECARLYDFEEGYLQVERVFIHCRLTLLDKEIVHYAYKEGETKTFPTRKEAEAFSNNVETVDKNAETNKLIEKLNHELLIRLQEIYQQAVFDVLLSKYSFLTKRKLDIIFNKLLKRKGYEEYDKLFYAYQDLNEEIEYIISLQIRCFGNFY